MTKIPCSGEHKPVIDQQITLFNNSDFARMLRMRITEASDGYARVGMDAVGKNNPHNVTHGGAIFALADQAFGIAANCAGTDRVAVSVHIQYIAPATKDLVAVAHRVSENGPYSVFCVMVYEGERIFAEFDGVALQINPRWE